MFAASPNGSAQRHVSVSEPKEESSVPEEQRFQDDTSAPMVWLASPEWTVFLNCSALEDRSETRLKCRVSWRPARTLPATRTLPEVRSHTPAVSSLLDDWWGPMKAPATTAQLVVWSAPVLVQVLFFVVIAAYAIARPGAHGFGALPGVFITAV